MPGTHRVCHVKYFLLVYDRPRGELIEEPRVFDDHAAALSARFEHEMTDPNRDHEVIVLGGESLEALAETHARYFRRSAEPVG